ncbi:unnamed protein product [Paramecium sonneborni]|uniref:AAA+ ATPase domain-containing protein n=1 Tax=Paramecium sonneborni TaxID=65129 RepID=A0A8S1M8B8_9CILI|nr:unnamed protein product [Paramecium sonneborni]
MDSDNNKRFNFDHLSQRQLKNRLYKNINRYDPSERKHTQPLSNASKPYLIPKISKQRLEPITSAQATLGVTIQQGRILLDQSAYQSGKNIRNDTSFAQDHFKKPKNLSPLDHRLQSDYGMSILDDVQNPNSSVNDSIINLFQFQDKKKDASILKKQKKKQQQQSYLSPLDFIYLIRTDPEMADQFCYLNKRDHAYDYEIVEFEDRNVKEYMTISARGITYYQNEEATFLTIEEWQREANLFQDLLKIDFFRKYKLWKNFFLWKRLMRKKILAKNQELMVSNMFTTDKQLRITLLEVKRKCQQMASEIRFLDTSTTIPQTLENFKLKQEKHLMSNMDKQFDSYENQIQQIIIECCQKSLINFKETHRIPLQEDDDEERATLLVGDESGKEMPFTTEATIRTHFKRLRKFVKYLDYVIIDAKLQMMQNSVEHIVKQIRDFNKQYRQTSGGKRKGYYGKGSPQCWIIFEAVGKGESISFNTLREQLFSIFESVINNSVIRITTRHKEMLSLPELQQYIQDESNQQFEKVDIKSIITGSENFQNLCGLMRRELEYANKLKPFLKWYVENTAINIENQFKNKDVDEYRNAINRYKKQDHQFQEMEPTQEIGMILFDNHKLKAKIKSSAMNCILELYRFIPDYMYKKAILFTNKTAQLYSTIAVSPITVEQFVNYMEAVNVINNQFEDLSNASQEVTSMALLMDELKIKIQDQHKQKFGECIQQVNQLRKKVDDAMVNYDQNLNKFRKDMERMIPQVDSTVKDLSERVSEQQLSSLASDLSDMITFVTGIRKQVDELKIHAKKLNDYQIALNMEYTPFEKLEIFNHEFTLLERLWCGRNEWIQNYSSWLKQHFTEINLDEMNNTIEKLQKVANLCAKELDKNEVARVFKSDIEGFKGVSQVLQALKDPAISDKQWNQIRTLILENQQLFKEPILDPFTPLDDLKYNIQWITQIGLDQIKDKLSEIALRAAKEIELVKMLEQVESIWRSAIITVQPYRESKDVFILGNNEDLISKIDDTLLTVNNILASQFVEGIQSEVERQQALLRYFQELFDEWILHQRNWLYLEPILNSPYSAKNMVKESKIFQQADILWKKLMRNARDSCLAKKWADDYQNRLYFNQLRQNNNNFEVIQKALDEFLEKKRDSFQRFYFLSNDELLDILSNAKNIEAVQPYLKKCFDNLVEIQFDQQENAIGMVSAEGEIAVLKGYTARGEVEDWFKGLEDKMKSSLNGVMRQSLFKYQLEDTQRKDWIFEFPLQIIITIDSIFWTKITEENYLQANAEGDLDDWYDANVAMLDELTSLFKVNLNDLQRRTLVALVTQDVHFRDIVDNMRNESVESIIDFKWQQQLRFYHDEESVQIKQVNVKIMYGYEYLGSTTRIVVTPLTDRCWITLTGAIGIKLGALLQGPTATGKTETCKDLAKALGRFFIVFNCSDQITPKIMEKLFAGLAYCGAWICLDEFNRISKEVLSVIAQQVLTIREALLEYKMNFYFFSKNIQLNPDLGIFITMNPNYTGRTQIPDNLKVLFRPISMMIPDYRLITEIELFVGGFSNAKDLSRKIIKLYQLSSEQLSQQDHYDFGLRAIKSLLVMASKQKRADFNINEDVVLVKAICESNLPKFLFNDIRLFNAIVNDLFPGIEIGNKQNEELETVIKYVLDLNQLQEEENFVKKIIQFDETLKVRFGVMLVGVTMGGKSQVQNVLRECYNKQYVDNQQQDDDSNHDNERIEQKVQNQILNPKALSIEELYGQFDMITQQWTDGLASNIMRRFAQSNTQEKKWIVFDGPVDTMWIENLNSVLDDSMTLCLSNGERIKLNTQMRIIFEVLDLSFASPATVSRCGMVYFDQKVLGYEPIVNTEAMTLVDILSIDIIDHLLIQIKAQFNKCVGLIIKQCKQLIPINETQMAVGLIKIMRMIIQYYNQQLNCNLREEIAKKHIEKLFVWVFAWSVGATLVSDDYSKFESIVNDTFSVDILPRGSLFACLVRITKIDGLVDINYIQWNDIVPQFQYIKDMSYFDMIVQTPETVAYGWFVKQAIHTNCPIFITGMPGTGKTVLINSTIQKLRDKGLIALMQMTFSAKTSSQVTQQSIEYKLQAQRNKGRAILMPPPGKKFVFFVDDVNMPTLEQYGASSPIELLRQFIDYKGVYDRKTFNWKDVDNTNLICACGPPGGGRSPLSIRFIRHFVYLSVPNSSDETLSWIFSRILKAYFKNNYFKNEINDLCDNYSIVYATLQMYQEIQNTLKPTPEKSHYIFNLRDVSKVFQGILEAKPLIYQKSEQIIRLWAHETCRVFMDRLINQNDQDWFKENLIKNILINFKIEYKVQEFFNSQRPFIFADFQKKVELQDRIYEEVKDYNSFVKNINEYMLSQTKMNLALFKDAIVHLTRICRVLRLQRGHYMLIGIGGSGKKSLTQLGAALAGCKFETFTTKKNYGKKEFKDLLFRLMCAVGIENKLIAFYFADNQLHQESFLEDLNNLLNSGEVPNMLTKEDLEIINSGIQAQIKELKINDAYSYFVQKVRSNLHIVLGLSPIRDQFRVWLRKFPKWLQKWPQEAFLNVAQMFLATFEFKELTKDLRQNLYQMFVHVHLSVDQKCQFYYATQKKQIYTTPKQFLDLIESYKSLLTMKKEELETNKQKLSLGLHKLQEANSIISGLKVQLTQMQPILKQKTIDQEQLLQKLQVDSTEANRVKQLVSEEERQVIEQASKIKETKAEAEKFLNEAIPTLNAALEALNTINKNDISEIRSNNNPSPIVRFTLECVAILFEEKLDWDSIKKLLADPNFLQKMKALDINRIKPNTQNKIKAKIISNPEFVPNIVQKYSGAAKQICEWVRAVSEFTDTNNDIEKKKTQVEAMNKQLEMGNQILAQKQSELALVVKKVTDLEIQFNQNKQEKDHLDQDIQTIQQRLIRAEELTIGLADEQERWKTKVQSLTEEIQMLLGDIFLASSTVTYLGAFSEIYRNQLLQDWILRATELAFPMNKNYNFEAVLGDPLEIKQWITNGLPNDSFSKSNGIIQKYCRSYPLFIDPQFQANTWIKNTYKDQNLKVLKLTQEGLIKHLENAVQTGIPLLIEDVQEQLENCLEPLLLKQIKFVSRKKFIKIGDREVEFDPNFKLFFSTKLCNPQYLTEIFIRVTVINFTVTQKGLEEQLLGDIVQIEKPDMEDEKKDLVLGISSGMMNLRKNEDKILNLLANSKGMILDNLELIESLKLSKQDAIQVKETLVKQEQKSTEIEAARKQYLPVATRGSLLYFVIADFAQIDPMYQFSLNYFKKIYQNVIRNSEKNDDIKIRIATLLVNITEIIYQNICRGLFNQHKLIFSFFMAVKIQLNDKEISQQEWNYFIKGANLTVQPPPMPNTVKLSPQLWNELYQLTNVHQNIDHIYNPNFNSFKEIENLLQSENPWDLINDSLTPFQKLMIMKVLKQEELYYALIKYVEIILGKKYTINYQSTIEDTFNDTDHKTPLLFILSPGNDPLAHIMKFANSKKISSEKLRIISLGQGQGIIAEKAIESGVKSGEWVILQNCHLCKIFMGTLERKIEWFEDPELQSQFNPGFRLILTSLSCVYFPVSVLQNSIKLTNEYPKGFKQNLNKIYTDLTADQIENCEKKETWKKLLYSLSFFHAIIQERRKFGSLGWNQIYDFNDSDLEISQAVLKNFLDLHQEVPWDAILYVIGEITYGGRVTDDWDKRCLLTILSKYINEDALIDGYYFSESEIYKQPREMNINGYRKMIKKYPDIDKPELFGMNENANIALKLNKSKKAIDIILSIQSGDSFQQGEVDLKIKTSDEIVLELCEVLYQKIPFQIKEQERKKKPIQVIIQGAIQDVDFIKICLNSEVQRYNQLLQLIGSSIKNLQAALKGELVMSIELEKIYRSVLNNEVPQIWINKAYLSLKPLGSFFDDLIKRVNFFRDWFNLDNGNPKGYWISAFFFPQGFLTSLLQTFSKKNQVAIDMLGFTFKFLNQIDNEMISQTPENGAYIYGLFIEGCRFDFNKGVLEDQLAGQLIVQAPIIHFIPSQDYKPNVNDYSMPIYKTSLRGGVLSTTGQSTNFIRTIDFPSKKSPDYWILNGAALITQLND